MDVGFFGDSFSAQASSVSPRILAMPVVQDESPQFDKVFGPLCLSDTVYDEGAKDVALSALTGISATIFACGQPSSGKTYTMRGIFESAVNDIYMHIHDTQERDFVIKISALEIYNEIVRDLLKPDSGPLRLLDDPKKGTIVEKLEEETVKDGQHLRHLIGICEAQRQVGETALNDTSSRSHQIIRLTVESRLREKSDCLRSYVASLNFVDLAGSDRALQAHADGIRLKEGSHINRSLLTFTTIIRKLSGGKSSGHVPYKDSKLTRIMKLSLGGNARTAFISTMSPAFRHVEQSRNTLSLASCAKEVTNNAQVNVIVSDKQLVNNLSDEQSVKILEKRVARLEGILRTSESSWWSMCSEALLMKKLENKKFDLEMEAEKFKRQRNYFLSGLRVDLLTEATSLEPEEVVRLELEEEMGVEKLKNRRDVLLNAKPKLDDLLKNHQGFEAGKGIPVQKDKFMTQRRGAPTTVHEMPDSPTYLLEEAASLEPEEEMEVEKLKHRRDLLLNAKPKLDDLLKKHQDFGEGKGIPVQKDKFMTRRRGPPATVHEMADSPTYLLKEAVRLEWEEAARLELEEHQGFDEGKGIPVQKDKFMTRRRGAPTTVHEMADFPTYLLKEAVRLEWEEAARVELEEEMKVKRLKCRRDLLLNAKTKLDDLLKKHQGFEAGKGIDVQKDEFMTQRRGARAIVHEMADSPTYLLKEAARLEVEDAARVELEEEMEVKRLKRRRDCVLNAKTKLDELLKKHQGFEAGKGEFMSQRRGARAIVHELPDSPTYLLKEAARLEVEDAARLELEEEMEVKRLKRRRDGVLNAKLKFDELLKNHQGFEAGKDEYMKWQILLQVKQRKLHLVNRLNLGLPVK